MIYLFLVIVFSSSVTALVAGVFGYNVVHDILEQQKRKVLLSLRNDLITFDKILFIIEKRIDKQADEAILNITEALVNDGRLNWDISGRDLKKIAEYHGATDISLINDSGIVVNSSVEKDIGLNLFGFSPRFKAFVQSIYGRNEIVGHRISISVSTGRMSMFKYYSPEGADFIVEIWIDVEAYVSGEYSQELYLFIFESFFTRVKEENPYLNKIGLYIGSKRPKIGLPLIKSDSTIEGDLNQIIDTLESGKEIRVKNNSVVTYYSLFTLKNAGLQFTNKIIVKHEYDFSPLYIYSWKLAAYSGASSIGIILVVYFLSSLLFNQYILKRISMINVFLSQIAGGNYETAAPVAGDDDIAQIALNIDHMKKRIVERENALRSNQKALIDARSDLERKVRERTRDLTRANQELIREVEERKRSEQALADAKAKVEAANRTRSVFIANMSHELRTPLNAIIGFSQLLGESSSVTDTDRQTIDIIRSNGENLLKLVNKVLELTRVDQETRPADGNEDRMNAASRLSQEELIRKIDVLPERLKRDFYRSAHSLDFDYAMELAEAIQEHDAELSRELSGILSSYRFDLIVELFIKADRSLNPEM